MNDQWDHINDWGTRAAAITAIFGAIYGIYRGIKTSITKVLGVANKINYISEQLASNGGTSLRDAINRIESRQVQTEQRERAFLRTHPNIICELDSSLELVWANKTFLDTLDVDSDTVVGYGWHNVICENDRERVMEQFELARQAVRDMNTTTQMLINANLDKKVNAFILATVMRSQNGACSGFLVTINIVKNKG
jgi:PAS domain-containing protein